MKDDLPSTPSATPRHLKRLSLNTSSPFSPASPSSPLSQPKQSPNGIASPSTLARSDSGRRIGSATRSLRLSQPPSASCPVAGPSSSSVLPHDFASPSPSTRVAGSPSMERIDSPLSTRTTPSSDRRARRTSSISYAKSPTIGSLPNNGGAASPVARGSPNPNSARASFEGGRPRLSLDEVSEEQEEGQGSEAGAGTEKETVNSADEEERRTDEPLNLGSGSALGFVNAQPTLTEQNADLLSFIAKKERKCLDLREELKRHESELALLKKKWESIVARSFQQQQQQQSASSSRHGPSQSISTASSASPNTSPTPRSAPLHPINSNPTHSLDLSLLSTTFDAADLLSSATSNTGDSRHGHSGSDPQIEIPESLKAAGNWLGGALGRALEVAVGMPPPAEPPTEVAGKRREREGMLASLQEEEEEEEGEENANGDRRRESRASSTETDSTSGSAEKESTAASSVQEEDTTVSVSQIKTSPLRRKPVQERSSSPLSSSASRRLFTSPPPSATFSSSNNTFPPSAPSTSPSHNRTRSSLASFSDSWTSLNKRWTNLTESETFKNSKRATLGLVDTFEQGLAQALGPLEPPSLSSPSMSRDGSSNGGEDRNSRSPRPSPFLSASSNPGSTANSPNPGELNERRLTEVPISPMPGQALSSVFASWSKGKEKKDEKGKGKAKEVSQNGFDWSAFQDQKGDEEEVEDWPAW